MIIKFDGKHPRIGKDVFIAPTAVLIGDVEVGDGTSIWFGAIGSGAVVLPYTTFGPHTVVAANSTVLERSEFPANVLIAGSPAKVKRELSGRSQEWPKFAVDHYVELQARYRAQGIDSIREMGHGRERTSAE